jgi:hypothetical protein
MRLRRFTVVLLCSGAAAVWACSLNPQPLPPDTNDAGFDGMVTYGPDAGGGVDANGSNGDGATPTGDASVDAFETDAATDAPSDASEDASDANDTDAIADAGEDG